MEYLVSKLLEDNSVRFRKRKSREATKQSYIKSLLTYFTLTIIFANMPMIEKAPKE